MTSALVLHQGAESSLDYFLHAALQERQWQPALFDTRRPPPGELGPLLSEAQVVVLVRYWPTGWRWRALLRQARSRGLRCVYWMDDDLFDRAGFQVLPRKYAAKLIRLAWDRQDTILRWCQELWVSTPALVERYHQYQPQLLPLRPLARVIDPVPSLTLGYHGTASHLLELHWLFPLVENLQFRYAFTLVELYGDDEIRRLYSPVPRVRIHHPVPWESYRELTAGQHLDLLLCPLLDHGFNGARAAVKFFDAVRMGAVGLYSQREPFTSFVRDGVDGFLLNDDPHQWLAVIEHLLNHPQEREKIARSARERAHDYVTSE